MLNDAKALINQQTGISFWRNSNAPIKRLRCTRQNSYCQLLPQSDQDDFNRDTPIFTCKFSLQEGNEHLLALANEDGKLAIHDSHTNNRYGIHAHNNAIFDLAWMFDRMKLVTASGDHTSKIYDIGNGEIRHERTFCGHTRSVKTVAFRKDDSQVLATGGRDGNIIMWDTRTDTRDFLGRADGIISNSHTLKVFTPSKSRKKLNMPTNSGTKSVTGLVFQDTNTLISCGAGDGILKVWDLRKHYTIHKRDALPKSTIAYPGTSTKNGYSSIIIDNEGIRLYANCLDNTIYCYNVGTYENEPVMRYTGHQNNTFYVKSSLSKDSTHLISGSSDEKAYIWNTKSSRPIVKLSGHSAEVTCVSWCSKNFLVVTCSDDMTHKIWTVEPEEIPEDWEVNGRGVAEVLPMEDYEYSRKSKRVVGYRSITSTIPCQRCYNETASKFCEYCGRNFSKRQKSFKLESANKVFLTDFGPRRLFGPMSNPENIDDELAKLLGLEKLPDYEPPKKLPKLSHTSTNYQQPTSDSCKSLNTPTKCRQNPTSDSSKSLNTPTKCQQNPSSYSCKSVNTPTKYRTSVSCISVNNPIKLWKNEDLSCDEDSEDFEPPAKLAKLEISSEISEIGSISSPTINLPNYVMDGSAPHLTYSPPKKKSQDWLTRLRIEKMLRQEMYDKTVGVNSPKMAKLENNTKSKKYLTPRSPILKYFKVTNSPHKCDAACSKYQNCSSNFSKNDLKRMD